MKVSKLIPLLLLTGVPVSFAEPTPTIQYLINTPASMLDVSLVRLALGLEQVVIHNDAFVIHGLRPATSPGYNWGQNRIEIAIVYMNRSGATELPSDLESECRRVIDLLRSEVTTMEKYGDLLQHSGYRQKSEPTGAEVQAEINNIIVFALTYFPSNKSQDIGRNFRCEGKMNDTGISIVK